MPLSEYLREHPISFFLSDLSRLTGRELDQGLPASSGEFPLQQLQAVDWIAASVDICRECGPAAGGRLSVHGYLRKYLGERHRIVFYDHGSGEIADMIALSDIGGVLRVSLFHCKASAEKTPGCRVEDICEVAAQAVKSVRWINQKELLKARIRHRMDACASEFVAGTYDELARALDACHRIEYTVAIVQPGLSAAKLRPEHARILVAASDYVARARGQQLELWCSA